MLDYKPKTITAFGKWFAKYPDTNIKIEKELVTWIRNNKKVVIKINNDVNEFVSSIINEPVYDEKIIDSTAIKALLENKIIIMADTKQEIKSKLIHLEASSPINIAENLTASDLEEIERESMSNRFPENSNNGRKLKVPQPLIRRKSFIVDDNAPSEISGLSENEIELLLNTLYEMSNKSYPSAGALYPINFIVEQKVNGKSNTYRYDTSENCVFKKKTKNISYKDYGIDPYLDSAETKIWFVAKLNNITYKYGTRGYRYSLIEAGHAAQYLIHLLNWNGYECRPFGGFNDTIVAENLGLEDELVVYSLGVVLNNSTIKNRDWIIAEESKCVLANNVPINHFVAVGERDNLGDQLQGYGIDIDYDLARIKSHAELAERIALVNCKDVSIKNSNGIAAHSNEEDVTKNAKLELYERHCVLKTWLTSESRTSIKIPNTKEGRLAYSLALKANVQIKILDIMDSKYNVPCVMPIIYSKEHGGIIISSAADVSELTAINKALLEIIKSLFFRLFIKETDIFPENKSINIAMKPEEHEEWYARSTIDKKITSFLTANNKERTYYDKRFDSSLLDEVINFQDLTSFSPDPSFWKVVRAQSEELLILDFGKVTDKYWERAEQVLSISRHKLNQFLHPIG